MGNTKRFSAAIKMQKGRGQTGVRGSARTSRPGNRRRIFKFLILEVGAGLVEKKENKNIKLRNLVKDKCELRHFGDVWLFANLWTLAHQAPLFMGFFRQEYWSELSFSPPGDLPDPCLLCLQHWQAGSLPAPPGKAIQRQLRMVREVQNIPAF